ncbi:LytTR family DNA-binding domain-containing protein [Isobaculum melis]|uniref:LytTr DNA-binding domain-containing protein n=1 Tax=Isobaculum melis TaxID=142588 RepID=A0A1H9UDL4_9LACT|nr:LytTR family DNA-binding domain-containing protein [Isobaculum melis]SES07660.1 LytTr DNA-binding domain-containing protein [Isobaculum melis]
MELVHKINNQLDRIFITVETTTEAEQQYEKIAQHLSELNKKTTVINGKNNRELQLPIRDIVLIEAEGTVCNLVTRDGQYYLLNKRLKDAEQLLNEETYFVKINKTTMINLYDVKEFEMIDHFKIQIETKNGYQQVVNRSFTKLFKSRMEALLK